MEIAIGIGIGIVLAAIAGTRKKHSKKVLFQDEPLEERKRRETDEVIAVILPTINNDK